MHLTPAAIRYKITNEKVLDSGDVMNDEQMEEIKRHFNVVAEGLKSEISIVAEGHDIIRREIKMFRNDVEDEFKEVKSLIKFSYAELEQRIQKLEQQTSNATSRLNRLEQQVGLS